MINRTLWGPILSVAPETSSMEGGARFISTPATTVLIRLLPDATTLRLEACEVDDTTAQITPCMSAPRRPVHPVRCALPQRGASHSGYGRTLADLPWAHYRVRLQLRVRKWFAAIAAATAASSPRLPTVAAP